MQAAFKVGSTKLTFILSLKPMNAPAPSAIPIPDFRKLYSTKRGNYI